MRNEASPRRYAVDKLTIRPDSPVRHFEPVASGRDRYGNRIFKSPSLAYQDRTAQYTKASLLVSQSGEQLLSTDLNLLQKIDGGLASMEVQRTQPDNDYYIRGINVLEEVAIGNGRMLMPFAQGTFSLAFKLDLGDVAAIVKVQRERSVQARHFSQPYFNEMLQIQAIQYDLGELLEELGVRMPTYLFASGMVAATLFEEGEEPDRGVLGDFEDTRGKGRKIHDLLSQYFLQKEYMERLKGNRFSQNLWSNVTPDIFLNDSSQPRTDNFVQKKDGTLVLIDPLYYKDEDEN